MSKKFNVLIGNGQLGSALARRVPNLIHLTRNNLDFSDTTKFLNQLHESLDNVEIQTIINTVAYTNVDKAEVETRMCENINANCVKILAMYANKRRISLIHYSTDFVFDGKKNEPYIESDRTSAISQYGRTKALGDLYIQENHDKYVILRPSWLYSMFAQSNFVKKIINVAYEKREISVVDDQIGAIVNCFDLSNITLDILAKLSNTSVSMSLYGLYNYAPQNFASRFEIANTVMQLSGKYVDPLFYDVKINPIKTDNSLTPAARPLNSCLDSSKIIEKFGANIRNWEQSLEYGFAAIKRVYSDNA